MVASAAGPGGVLTSFLDGIQELTDGTAGGPRRQQCAPAPKSRRLSPGRAASNCSLTNGGSFEAELVVSAAPAHALAGMVEELDPKMTTILREIPYAPMNVVCFGYGREKIGRDLDGFGYLIPRREGKQHPRHSLGLQHLSRTGRRRGRCSCAR